MPKDLGLRCQCATVRGVLREVSPRVGNRALCYCDDCQAFAWFLERQNDVLDPQGATDVFQLSPAKIAITAGADRLACVRLTPRGLFRWYAGCCNTPIGNTLSARLPFFGVVLTCVERPQEDPQLEQTLGPIQVRVFRKFAHAQPDTLPRDRVPLPLAMLRVFGLMLTWRLRGDHQRSPFFATGTGLPTVTPRVLSPAEREELRAKVSRSKPS